MENKINVLHVVTSVHVGGVSKLLLSYYEKMDHKKIHFDIVAIDIGKEHFFEKDFRSQGAKVYYMPKSYFRRFFYLFKIMTQHKYDVVHSHIELASAIYLFIAYMCGVKNRIAHAHLAFCNYNSFRHKILRFMLNKISTIKMGCTMDAIKTLFGPQIQDGKVLHNAIDIHKFSYNQTIRDEYRHELKLENQYIIGFVGRLTGQKNVFFVLDIFEAFLHNHPDSLLMVVGDGILKESFLKTIETRKLASQVIFLGSRMDVNNLMMAMDVLLMPSKYEGLGIVLIEAQTACLKCIASRETIPYKDTNISNYIHYCSVKAPASQWAKLIDEKCCNYVRENIDDIIRDNHYDIEKEVDYLSNFYYNI